MQAITTRFLPATNTRGARIKATASAGSITVSYDYGATRDQRHADVAIALAKKLGWKGKLINGGLHNGDEVFVFDNGDAYEIA